MDEIEEIDLKEIFDVFWSKKWILILLVIIGALCGVIHTKYFVTPEYSSSATLILSKPVSVDETVGIKSTITEDDIILNQKLISTYGEIIKSRRVINQVISNLNLKMKYGELIGCVSTTAVNGTDVLKVSVTTKDANQSARIVNEVIKVFSDEIVKIYSIKNVSIIDDGQVNNAPVNINLSKDMVVFALIFAVVGCAVIFLIYYFDTTIKSKEEIEKMLGVPVLAVIPEIDSTKEAKKHEKRK